MKLADVFRYSFNSLRHRQLRSWLTILGIVIGIASVVSLITIGQGFNDEVNRQLSVLGGNTIFVSPISASSAGSAAFSTSMPASAGKLYDKDVDRLRKIPEITDIARLTMARTTVEFKGKEITASISGVEPGVFERTTAIEIEQGRFLQETDRGVVVIGPKIAENTFGQNSKVGINNFLIINGKKYRVIGIMKKSASAFGSARTENGIFLQFDDARQALKGVLKDNEVGGIVLKTRDDADTTEVVEQIKAELDASRKVKPDERDYTVIDPKTIQQSISNILSLITLFLGAIASISLLVGALAIASSMFTSVLERTHEIGVLKAIGADRSDIRKIFLIESGVVGALGGFIGASVATTAVYIGSLFGLPATPNIMIGAMGVAFAFVIGVVSGYLPANRAADLSPIEALRYE